MVQSETLYMKTKELIALLMRRDPSGEAEILLWDHQTGSPKLWSLNEVLPVPVVINNTHNRKTIGPHLTYEFYKDTTPNGRRLYVPGIILT